MDFITNLMNDLIQEKMHEDFLNPHLAITNHVIGQSNSEVLNDDNIKKYDKIQDGLESSISHEGKERIKWILNEVHHLTDVEKLLLYLKLPSGLLQEDQNRLTPPSCLPTSSRKEQAEAVTWIKSHLEEHGDVCMPKAEVYDEYRQYCEQHELRPLCNADFGKMMKHAFPEINTRRLGQRGQSKYFYGGLRKKSSHTPPTLPELEISSKAIEVDTSTIESEIFKASCQVICEWADKLLESKFCSVQSIAEFLVGNMYVNTKSVAAFTLIAAMQESGKYNLKGSALFTSQPNTGGDKHKETNMLLQQKLHKNKLLQKQKEKLQEMKDEVQQDSSCNNTSTESKATVQQTTKSTVPVATGLGSNQVFKLSSSESSPVTTVGSPPKYTSPRKVQSPRQQQKISFSASEDQKFAKSQSSDECQTPKADPKIKMTSINDMQKSEMLTLSLSQHSKADVSPNASIYEEFREHTNPNVTFNITDYQSDDDNQDVFKDFVDDGSYSEITDEVVQVNKEFSEMKEETACRNDEASGCDAQTPGSNMEVDTADMCHVRKIDFDNLLGMGAQLEDTTSQIIHKQADFTKAKKVSGKSESSTSEKLSKSTGYLSLKKMLESKNDNQSGFSKSLALYDISHNTLSCSVNQSMIRSAFVPFSQVQSFGRKENSSFNQSASMTIPLIMPPSHSQTVSHTSHLGMIGVPSDLQTSPVNNSSHFRSQSDTILKFRPTTPLCHGNPNLQPSEHCNTSLSNVFIEPLNSFATIPSFPKETGSIVTVTSALSKIPSSDILVSSAQSSQNIQRQARTKFTPIRPKASPNKNPPARDQKGDNNTDYDKDNRPVSTILKEKRAKEQAVAVAKCQLSTVPFQPGIPLSVSGTPFLNQLTPIQGIHHATSVQQLASIQQMTSTVTPKEVVIIVNNPPVTSSLQQLLHNSSMVTKTGANLEKQLSAQISEISSHAQRSRSISESRKTNEVVTYSGSKFLDNTDFKTETTSEDIYMLSDTESINVLSDDMTSANNDSDMDLTPTLRDDAQVMPTFIDLLECPERVQINRNNNVINVDVSKGCNVSYCGALDNTITECPMKIPKLNITSPNRPESACSNGRETPLKLQKSMEHCSSRPDSASSIGRETPSGARKRKSSGIQPRQNFKRLNSTGDDGDDGPNLSVLLSPDNELLSVLNPRRAQSAFEPDKTCKGKHQRNHSHQHQSHQKSRVSSQSPDISSLEQEALIESFPNSLHAMRPNKMHKKQSSSVGVSAQASLPTQQKLIKQQEDLDERVKNFLQQTQSETSVNNSDVSKEPSNTAGRITSLDLSNTQKKSEIARCLSIVSDRGKPYVRPSSVVTFSTRNPPHGLEPSGLPSDVADWIIERQSENKSTVSDTGQHANRSANDLNIGDFQFEVDHEIKTDSLKKCAGAKRSFIRGNVGETFTVPKAPPLASQRSKEPSIRLNIQQADISQRCQSLPIFPSLVQSPVSPVACPIGPNHAFNRASSMSPRTQSPRTQSLWTQFPSDSGSEFHGNVTSPNSRKHILDAHPHSVCSQQSPKVGTYLRSIQQTLKKPGNNPAEINTARDTCADKIPLTLITGGAGGLPSSHQLSQQHIQTLLQQNQESSVEMDDPCVSQTPVSDSGYHSSGPSPVLNSTPVSGHEHVDFGLSHGLYKHSIVQSPVTMVKEFTSPIAPQRSLAQQPKSSYHQQQQNMTVSVTSNNSVTSNPLRSSMYSAFIPIQGSHHENRCVTPIKPNALNPSCTVPDDYGNSSCNLLVDSNQPFMTADVSMVSPRLTDPPSYEMAVEHLKLSSAQGTEFFLKMPLTKCSVENLNSNISEIDESMPVLSNMGGGQQIVPACETFGPFATKLVKLSQYTQRSDCYIGQAIQNIDSLDIPSPESKYIDIETKPHLTNIPSRELKNIFASLQNDHSERSGMVTLDKENTGANQYPNITNILEPNQALNKGANIGDIDCHVLIAPRIGHVQNSKNARAIVQDIKSFPHDDRALDPSYQMTRADATSYMSIEKVFQPFLQQHDSRNSPNRSNDSVQKAFIRIENSTLSNCKTSKKELMKDYDMLMLPRHFHPRDSTVMGQNSSGKDNIINMVTDDNFADIGQTWQTLHNEGLSDCGDACNEQQDF